MYRLDTGQARTDIYEQPNLDFSIMQRNLELRQSRKSKEQQLKAKQEQANQDDIMANLSKLGEIDIMPNDQQLFGDKATEIRAFVEKNHDALNSGDTKTKMQYDALVGDYKSSANQSAGLKKELMQRGDMLAKNPGDYDEDVFAQHFDRFSSKNAGNWTPPDERVYFKNINLLDDITGPTKRYAETQAKDTPYGKTFTLEQSKELLYKKAEDGPIFRQIVKNFNALPEDKRLGKTDPVEWYVEKYSPDIVVGDTKAGPSSGGSGSSSKEPKLRANYNKTGDSTGILSWEYVTPPDNPYMTTSIGDVKPGIIHDDGANTYMEVTTKPDSDGYSENKRLGFQETADFIRLKLGTTLGELRKGQSPAHIDTKIKDVSSSVDAGKKAAEKSRQAPKKGDTKAVKEGTAVWNGTKWELQKPKK